MKRCVGIFTFLVALSATVGCSSSVNERRSWIGKSVFVAYRGDAIPDVDKPPTGLSGYLTHVYSDGVIIEAGENFYWIPDDVILYVGAGRK